MVVFINMTIIKQNNMVYQYKVIFYIWDGFEYGFGVGTYIPVARPRVLKSEKTRQIEFGSGG